MMLRQINNIPEKTSKIVTLFIHKPEFNLKINNIINSKNLVSLIDITFLNITQIIQNPKKDF